MTFEKVIGLEIHVELNTKTKIFCSCSTNFGDKPNENVCPVCLGLPGALPSLNKKVIYKAVKAGNILGCKINKNNVFDRKNYFYPDLPKAYQISQLYAPICIEGSVHLKNEQIDKTIRIHEIHMEEDAGKLIHEGEHTLVDYNRCGVPLIEIVTEPDFRSEDEVELFLNKLREDLSFADVSECKMEEGKMRVDVNLSLRPSGSDELGTRTETKNLNSVKAIKRAILFEEQRQTNELKEGKTIKQETRKWDDDKGVGSSMRSKENAEDYRYFPDPDLMPNELTDDFLKDIKSNIPALPEEIRKKYIKDYNLNKQIVDVLTIDKDMNDLFEKAISTVSDQKEIKEIAGLVASEIARMVSDKEPKNFEELIQALKDIAKLITSGSINRLKGKEVLEIVFIDGGDAKKIAESKNYIIKTNDDEIQKVIIKILESNGNSVQDYQNGKEKALDFLVGQVMRELKGAVNPVKSREMILKEIGGIKANVSNEDSKKKNEIDSKQENNDKKKDAKQKKIIEIKKDKVTNKTQISVKDIKLENKYRTHTCGQLTKENIGEEVVISGWIHRIRDHGGITFVDLRDQYGMTQVVVSDEMLKSISRESVILFKGKVLKRDEDTINENITTGDIEVKASELKVLGKAENELPFDPMSSKDVNEEVRLKYRYLDIRNNKVLNNILLRTEIIKELRRNMDALGFTEIQTPIIANSSPEGARDYLIPSRKHKGMFYALPQAPQQFKQLLMVSGIDKYYQIAPCFRDEDARADRSPGEFYQLDFEMAFATQNDVFTVGEYVLHNTFKKFTDKKVTSLPFPVLTFNEAMNSFGTDKPDLRNPLRIIDVSDFFNEVDFMPFKGKPVKAIRIPMLAKKPKSFFKDMEKFALSIGMGGLGYISVNEDHTYKGPIDKFFNDKNKKDIKNIAKLEPFDVLYFICDDKKQVLKFAGEILSEVAKRADLIKKDSYEFCYIKDFPMYEVDEETGKIDFTHNPFSMPDGELDALLNKDPLEITALQYDIVCNGIELSSGAVRNHIPEVMEKAFEIAGYKKEVLKEKFSALYDAFHYGAPPHAGMAPGIDRIVMLLLEEENIREVIPFPLNSNAINPMLNSPNTVTEEQLRDVHIKIRD